MTVGRDRFLRRENRRLRWRRGNCTLNRFAPHPEHGGVRRDMVMMLVKTRQWRLAFTVAVIPTGYVLSKKDEPPPRGLRP